MKNSFFLLVYMFFLTSLTCFRVHLSQIGGIITKVLLGEKLHYLNRNMVLKHCYFTLRAKLHSKGYKDFNLKELIGKIRKLRQKYKSLKDQKNKSGKSFNQKGMKIFPGD